MRRVQSLLVNDDGHLVIMGLCWQPCTLGDVLFAASAYGVKNIRRTISILIESGILHAVRHDYSHYNYACLLALTESGKDVFIRQSLADSTKRLLNLMLLSNLANSADVSVHVVMANAHKMAALLSDCSRLNAKRPTKAHVKRQRE